MVVALKVSLLTRQAGSYRHVKCKWLSGYHRGFWPITADSKQVTKAIPVLNV